MKNNSNFSFLEPNSYALPETKIESYWKNIFGPYSLIRVRSMQFSSYSSMTYSPVKYIPTKFILDKILPTDEWIIENLSTFVRDEMDDTPYIEMPEIPIVEKIIKMNDHSFNKLLLESEAVEDYQQPNISSNSSPEEIAKAIFNILCNSKIGSTANRKNNDEDSFVKDVAEKITNKERLLFICPGMPFKDQNRFRVPFNAGVPDMAEIAFIIRMCNLVSAIYQNHAHGADIIILSDGVLYGDIFNIDQNLVKTYMERLIYYRNKTNSQGSVSIICLKELIDRSSEDNWTWELVQNITNKIKKEIENKNIAVLNSFKTLVKGMKRNTNSKKTNSIFKDLDDKTCWEFLMRDDVSEISEEHKDLWKEFDAQTKEAAYKYAAINLMLRYTNLIKKFFPDSIRATIHPKKGQFSFAGENRAYAWNGVAWSEEWPKTIFDINVKKFTDLQGKINQVVFEHSGLPCFYTAGSQNKNIEIAKKALLSYGWTIPNTSINGRQFVTTDMNTFIELGKNDEFFSWERKIQTNAYFQSLFEFRLNHYYKYGFGIHGIWENNLLIGQCGLQVLNEDVDEVEFIVFLGKNFTGKKYGTMLAKYVIDRCKEFGMNKLFGIVRADNEAGQALMLKFGGKTDRTIKHYNHDGSVFKLI